MRAPWAVVCDFDGTALTEDLGDAVSQHFAGHAGWLAAEDEYRAGRMSFGELIVRIFAPVTADAATIADFARRQAVFRDGFVPFLQACADAGRPFVVASAGLDVYIEPVLDLLPRHLRDHLQVRANRATCSPAGLTVDFHPAPAEDGCGGCGFCKAAVVRELQRAGHRVVVCGDGTSDRCAAGAADLVFATRRLVEHCQDRGIAHRTFRDFGEVMAAFPGG